ncbi:SDR family oxidoreductase [Mesorhizobium sp. M0894]|uniref:SDR family oxidoreductase n=1 Tax=unclassified Mesorhizobium TaxID=325217 RepID=UPI00333CE317
MLSPRFRLKLRTSNDAPGAAEAAALCDIAHGRQIRPTEPSALIEKFVLGVANHTLEVAGYKASEPSEEETQLTILPHWAMPTSPPKTALASLTQWMGRDRAGEGVGVNTVCRNECDTPMLRIGFAARGLDPNTAVADLDGSVPRGRVVRPEDIADVVLLLASDAARCMCGAFVEVNGGKAVA